MTPAQLEIDEAYTEFRILIRLRMLRQLRALQFGEDLVCGRNEISSSAVRDAAILHGLRQQSHHAIQLSRQIDPKDTDPVSGMSKAEVISKYGPTTRSITTLSNGYEVWVYTMHFGQAFIPFNFGYHPKILSITFDPNGHVQTWSYMH